MIHSDLLKEITYLVETHPDGWHSVDDFINRTLKDKVDEVKRFDAGIKKINNRVSLKAEMELL